MTSNYLRFSERKICDLNKCYCTATYTAHNGEPFFLVAGEQNDPCYLVHADGTLSEQLWSSPGGVMSMVQIPDDDGRTVLGTQQFYGPDDSTEAKLVVARGPPTPAGTSDHATWRRFIVAEMPFLHRFDVVPSRNGTKRYIIACTLKSSHREPGDWSDPGKVLAAELPADFVTNYIPPLDAPPSVTQTKALQWTVLREKCLKNHGYSRHVERDGTVNCVVGCDDGVFVFTPPEGTGDASDQWVITPLSTVPASDASLVDLDGDGQEELLVISPFHGDQVVILHLNSDGKYEKVYEYAPTAPFAHAIWGGQLSGKPAIVLGHRAGSRDLLLFYYDSAAGTYTTDTIARGRGPANVTKLTYQKDGQQCESIICCNRETDVVTAMDVL